MWQNLINTIKSRHFWSGIKAMHLFHLSRQGSLILVAILLSKSHLGLPEIGTYELLLYGLYLISFWWVVGVIQAMLSQAAGESAEQQDATIRQVYWIMLLLSLAICGIAWWQKEPILSVLTNQTDIPHWGLWMLISAIHLPTALTENILLLKDRSRQLFLYAFWSGPAWILGAMLPIWLGGGLAAMLMGLLVVAIIKHLYLWYELWRLSGHGHTVWLPILGLALPLIGYSVLGAINVSVDAWFMSYFYPGNEAQFAIYRYGAREFPLVVALAAAFGNALLPLVGKNHNEGMTAIRDKSTKLLHLLFPITIVLLLTSHWWFTALFSVAFQNSIPIFNVLLLLILSRLIFTNTILIGLKKNYVILSITVLEVLLNIGVSWFLFTRLGMIGLAIGTVLAYSFEKLAQILYLWIWEKIPPSRYLPWRWWLFYTTILLLGFSISGTF